MANITIQELMDAGVHFGHQVQRWNPKMRKFIYGERNGVHLFDLNKTLTQIEIACGFLHELVLGGGQVLFVGTKKQAQQELKEAALRTGMPYCVDRWLGGTLTNLRTIRNSVKRMREIDAKLESADAALMPKKELASLRREQFKLHRNLDGIVNMEQLPGALYVVDIVREEIAVREARRLRIPIVAIVDSNADPDWVTYPIAGNDDAIRSIKCITGVITQTILEAQAELGKSLAPVESVSEPTEASAASGAPVGPVA
ncbi:MAG: 30S ribosomal protein S2 [Verrucomicrobiae bacterium]|nr:30S ribosomal protein S2 [Verrucomicrobiae bacterium]MDW8343040.1 30S ribosomal protein S2 [Verrucomicrobiae bacterium]